MNLVHLDEKIIMLAEPTSDPESLKVGQVVVWMEVSRRIQGEVVKIETDVESDRRIITVAIESVGPRDK